MRTRRRSGLAVAATALLTVTACGGGDGETGDGDAEVGGGDGGDSITLNAMTMVLPNVPSAPLVE